MAMSKLRELLKIAEQQHKKAFVDPAMAAGGGAPPMDPAMMGGGGAPPMDPAMMGGGAPPMDPAMMGGAPPMDPAMMGGGGGPPPPGGVTAEEVRAIVTEAMGGAGAGGPAGSGAAGLKPKIDVNVEIMQMKMLLSKIVDAMGIPVPTQEMVATPEKLDAMAGGGEPGADPTAGGGGGGSAIPPIEPMGGASPDMAAGKMAADGEPYTDPAPQQNRLSGKAAAMMEVMRRRREAK